jgi:hypothetical protein
MVPFIIIIIIIIIGSTTLGGAWPPQANVTSDSILGILPPVSATQFLCVFLYPGSLF